MIIAGEADGRLPPQGFSIDIFTQISVLALLIPLESALPTPSDANRHVKPSKGLLIQRFFTFSCGRSAPAALYTG